MVNIFLIRHGKASSGWNSLDPSLDNEGERQSREVSKKLLNYSSKDFDIFSSPMMRCMQTSEPFCKKTKKEIIIDRKVSEIPSPINDLDKRVVWLRRVLPLNWEDLMNDKDSAASGIDYRIWRSDIIEFLKGLKNDAFIFTHFVVINSVVSFLKKRDEVVSFNPDNTSVTHLKYDGKLLKIISLGAESVTKIN